MTKVTHYFTSQSCGYSAEEASWEELRGPILRAQPFLLCEDPLQALVHVTVEACGGMGFDGTEAP